MKYTGNGKCDQNNHLLSDTQRNATPLMSACL